PPRPPPFPYTTLFRSRARAGLVLDEDLEPGGGQLAESFGYQGHAPLTGRGLPGDADFHGHHLTLSIDDRDRMGRSKDTEPRRAADRKSTRLNSSHLGI